MRHPLVMASIMLLALLALVHAVIPAEAQGSEADTVLFLHWVSESEPSRDLGGHSVRNYMDTSTDWEDTNRSVTSGSKWEEDWYVHPSLAEDLTSDNVTLGLWMNASGGQKRAQITLSLMDVADAASDPYGTTVAEYNFGNTPLFATPHFMAFSLDFDPHTFVAGHSIRVLISMTPGTSTFVTIVWDTATADSRLTVRTADRLDLPEVGVKDADGEPTTGLDPLLLDKGVTLYAVATDPLGLYDVAQVRATLEGPDGQAVLDNVSMTRPELPRGASPAEFTMAWDYGDADGGRYTLTVWAVDLTGVSYLDHFGHGSWGPYQVLAISTFSVGEVYTVNMRCLDGGDRPVEGATVSDGSRDAPVVTDDEGRASLDVFGGTATLTATWHGVQVGTLTTAVDADVPSSDPLVVRCAIYDVVLRAVDGRGDPLVDAAVQVTPPAGWGTQLIDRTDYAGEVILGLVPGAGHAVLVLWMGFAVAETTFLPEADGTVDVPCAVHWATFRVTDADGNPLPSVQLVAMEAVNLGVAGFGTTDGSGDLPLRLPDTTYRVEVFWRNIMVLREDDVVMDGEDTDVTLACSVFRATVVVVDGNGDPLPDVPVALEDATGAVVATAISGEDGTVVLQVGEGSYTGTALLRTTYRWTAIDTEASTDIEVNTSGSYQLGFDGYPPSVLGTVQMWTVVSLLVIFLLLMYVVWLWRASLRGVPAEAGDEGVGVGGPAGDMEAEEDVVGEGTEAPGEAADDEAEDETGAEPSEDDDPDVHVVTTPVNYRPPKR